MASAFRYGSLSACRLPQCPFPTHGNVSDCAVLSSWICLLREPYTLHYGISSSHKGASANDCAKIAPTEQSDELSFSRCPQIFPSYKKNGPHNLLRCSFTSECETVKPELLLPLQSEEVRDRERSDSERKFGDSNPAESIGTNANLQNVVREVLDTATNALGGRELGKAALYASIGAFGVVVGNSIVSSLQPLPLLPEGLQIVGAAYSILVGSRILQGQPISSIPSSPFKAIVQLLDNGSPMVQKTTNDISQIKGMKIYGEYERVLAEKQGLEAVAMQLAQEREDALSEVGNLKQKVQRMTTRMRSIEEMLDLEIQQLIKNNLALENVALQLACERNAAIKELEDFKQLGTSEKHALKEQFNSKKADAQDAPTRDLALSEMDMPKEVVAGLINASSSTKLDFAPQQEES